MTFTGFDRRFFALLRQLKAHNDREWFAAHKARFRQEVEGPALAFVEAFAPHLRRLSPRMVADPRRVGGSMFRIYRDTRFSHDKSPFKTHVGLRFWHDGKGLESPPVFYLHLEPGGCFGGGGLYHPDPRTLRRVRARIGAAPKDWKAVLAAKLDITGDTLQRVPPGFAADHLFAADLRRKDHIVMEDYTQAALGGPDAVTRFARTCGRIVPLMKFLTEAIGQRW